MARCVFNCSWSPFPSVSDQRYLVIIVPITRSGQCLPFLNACFPSSNIYFFHIFSLLSVFNRVAVGWVIFTRPKRKSWASCEPDRNASTKLPLLIAVQCPVNFLTHSRVCVRKWGKMQSGWLLLYGWVPARSMAYPGAWVHVFRKPLHTPPSFGFRLMK
jgi:hypothetical protein